MSVETELVNCLINKLSSLGTYQKRNFLYISLAIMFSAVQYGYVFTTRSAKYRCFIAECEDHKENIYYTSWMKDGIPIDGESFSKCNRYASKTSIEASEICTVNSFNKSLVQECNEFVFEEGDMTIERDFNITCKENLWKLTILGTLGELGEVFYMPFLGYLSDRYGRRTMFIYSLVISSIIGVVKSFSQTYIEFVILEFVSAFFTSGIYSSGFILAVELLTPEHRVLGSTITAMAYPFGEVLLGLAAWFSSSWRFMLRIMYIPGLLFLLYFWLMDESLRFLFTNRKEEEARKVIKKIAKTNKIDIPENFNLCYDDKDIEGNITTKTLAENKEERETFLHLFRHPRILIRILNCSLSWISCTFLYFGLTIYSVSLTGNIYLNFMIMAAIELPAYVICYYLLDRLGRRILLAAPLVFSGFICIGVIFVTEEHSFLQLLLPLLGKFAATMAFKTIYIYTAEMFPTTLRHSLLAFCSMFGRAGTMAAPQLPLLASISPILPLLLFGFLGLSTGFLSFFLPETTRTKLPDTIKEALEISDKKCDIPKQM